MTKGANYHGKKLTVKFCKTYDNKPLAVVDGLGGDMELRPEQLRSLANQLREIAKEAEQEPGKGKYTYTF